MPRLLLIIAQAALDKAVRERDFHLQAAKRESASAAASKAEAEQLRAALSRNNSEASGHSSELTALQV
jgi:hypothetical protein